MNIVQTKYGKLKGVNKQNYTLFRGVPYAKPPVGQLRWQAPQPPASWDGVRDATRFAARCPQFPPAEDSPYTKEFFNDEDYLPPMSEDCLYLNIWAPKAAKASQAGEAAGLPVAVWIHGGGFGGGFGSEMEFDGKAYCARGVILVTLNYRLGPFGFLAHKWLSEESGKGTSGNYGLMDQMAAVEWVRENIAAFGGDAEKITIFGQSAGAMSVQALVSSDRMKGKVARAILQSGGGYQLGMQIDKPLAQAEEYGGMYTDVLEVASLEALRAVPADKLLQAVGQLREKFGAQIAMRVFSPCVDGGVLPQGYDATVEQGLHLDIDYMLGSTSDDITCTPEQKESGQMSPVHRAGLAWSQVGEAQGRKAAFIYYFSHPTTEDDLGAFHSYELWYMFGTLGRNWRKKTAEDYQLSRQMVDHWCAFIRTGDPNVGNGAQWHRCTKENPYYREFL